MDDVDRIVAGLSPAQRAALLNASKSFARDRDRVAATGATRKALRDRGLGHGDWCYLTPLGLRVRARLAEVQSHE